MNKAANGKIEIVNAGKIYDPAGIHVVAVENCSFNLEAGQFVSVVGPSGCGKSTLLNTIAGFDTITSGEILMDGELLASPEIQTPPGPDRVVVFQGGALFPWKTVSENIIYGPVIQKNMERPEAEKMAISLLNRVGLTKVETKYPSELSSGVQRRVEILRALINQPKIMMLDEPFRALDAVAKSVMHNFLLELFDENPRTMFFITHDLDEAIYLSDLVVVMTTRPAKVKKIIKIDLPRPRRLDVIKTEIYRNIKADLLSIVHEEALKAFKAGEREMA
ncbi:MAG TPA: ABC transporter ATP-binding protein [Nitrospirae bacterium]|nr:ABC transporter ATP-binding protein [Nitrospirota bacterium]